MITLIIVDCQNDFITGTVSSKNARQSVEEIKKYIKNHKNEIAQIIFTVNWHPYNHCSFKQYGGQYPHHCIQYTPGACIEPKLLKYVQSYNIKYQVSTRGEIVEIDSLGAFQDIEFAQDEFGSRYYLDSVVMVDANTDFVICGIGENTKETITNLLAGGITPKVFMPGITSLDNTFSQFVKNNGLEKTT